MNQFIPGVALEINRAQPCSNGIACTTGWSADQTFNRRINFRSIGLRVRAKAAFSSSPLSPSSPFQLSFVLKATKATAVMTSSPLLALEPRLITKKRTREQLSRDNFSPVSSLITDHFLSMPKLNSTALLSLLPPFFHLSSFPSPNLERISKAE